MSRASVSLFSIGLVALTGLMSLPANAALVGYDNRALFEAAAAPYTIEDFNSYVADVPFHTAAVDAGDFVISMTGTPSTSGYNMIDVVADSSESDVNGTVNMRVFTDNSPAATLVFTFGDAITSFGADFKSFNDSSARTQVYVDGILIVPAIGASSGLNSFFGFISDAAFTTVTFVGLANDVYGIDNITYGGTVPEPGILGLFGLGLFGLGVTRRRRSV